MKKKQCFTYSCPHCGVTLDFDGDPRGETYQCPECSSAFTIPTVLKKAKKAKPPKGCYLIGFFLGIIGIFIAHLISGSAGAKEALRGFVFQIICILAAIFAFYFLPVFVANNFL